MTANSPADANPEKAATTRPQPPDRQPGKRRKPPPRSGTGQRQTAATASVTGALDTRTPRLRVRVDSPASLLAVIPGLLGFAPGHSIVVIGTEPGSAQVRVTLRYDLPDSRSANAVARHAVGLLTAQGITTAVAVGYGDETAVTHIAAALREHAAKAGITLTELLRVDGQRYWSYLCADPACCSPEGTSFHAAGHRATRALATSGQVLASRDELVATLAAVDGQLGSAMRRATARAHADIARCAARLDAAGMRVSTARLTATLGQVAVRDAIVRYRDDGKISAKRAAWLTVALRQLRVRDDAWARMDTEHRAAHLRLWTDLTKLARPGYVSAPAALLAFCAWQDGNGALANVALDRALADNPRYSMAVLLRQALDSGAPPSMARLPMTPEEVAEAYDAAEAHKGAQADGQGSARRTRGGEP